MATDHHAPVLYRQQFDHRAIEWLMGQQPLVITNAAMSHQQLSVAGMPYDISLIHAAYVPHLQMSCVVVYLLLYAWLILIEWTLADRLSLQLIRR